MKRYNHFIIHSFVPTFNQTISRNGFEGDFAPHGTPCLQNSSPSLFHSQAVRRQAFKHRTVRLKTWLVFQLMNDAVAHS